MLGKVLVTPYSWAAQETHSAGPTWELCSLGLSSFLDGLLLAVCKIQGPETTKTHLLMTDVGPVNHRSQPGAGASVSQERWSSREQRSSCCPGAFLQRGHLGSPPRESRAFQEGESTEPRPEGEQGLGLMPGEQGLERDPGQFVYTCLPYTWPETRPPLPAGSPEKRGVRPPISVPPLALPWMEHHLVT